MDSVKFKDELKEFLESRIRVHQEGWKHGYRDLMDISGALGEVVEELTGGALSVLTVVTDSDGHQDVKIKIRDSVAAKEMGIVDRYFVPKDGAYPLELVLPGMDRIRIGDKEGLQHRMLSLFADFNCGAIKLIANRLAVK